MLHLGLEEEQGRPVVHRQCSDMWVTEQLGHPEGSEMGTSE